MAHITHLRYTPKNGQNPIGMRVLTHYRKRRSETTKRRKNHRKAFIHAASGRLQRRGLTASRGLSRPRALKVWITQHLPTARGSQAHPGPWTNRVTHTAASPHGLKIPFPFPSGRHGRGEPPGVPERGGCKPHRGLGAQPPAVGAEGGAGRAGGSNSSPFGGLLDINVN